jgi:anhydro-N-acetylmuramic acid kinase
MSLSTELYIGLLSGTSADGIDAALVDFKHTQPIIIATHYAPFSADLRERILSLSQPSANEIQRLGELDVLLGHTFAKATLELLNSQSISAAAIKGIGCHGQNIRHHPHTPHRFTIQVGDPNIIAAETGITTVADFRRKDMALGGQGAPLVPAFHQKIFSSLQYNRVIVNIGGIANITLLSCAKPDDVIGFDTGPGNALLDEWIYVNKKETHDKSGAWAEEGNIHLELLEQLLSDIYFDKPAPKSTGREYFNLAWLEKHIRLLNQKITPIDVQTTITELTAQTIMKSVRNYFSDGDILICGGGAHNAYLVSRLTQLAASQFNVTSTEQHGVHPDWIEAMLFAWLARQTLMGKPSNLPSVTGANRSSILGGIYYP